MTTIICGPTAVGKTDYAIQRALEENGEIISADSGQVYRGLDVGTAKPNAEERKRVPFHLIDVLNPDERFSAADFRRLALQKIEEIEQRGKKPFVAGGTGLYLKVLENGIFEGPSADPELRRKLEERIKKEGLESLVAELKERDPVAASEIDPKNRQRVIRAMEVCILTGGKISEFWGRTGRTGQTCPTPLTKLGLTLPREELNRRIEERIDRMIGNGWIEETRSLVEKWGWEAPALRIIGYKELGLVIQGKLKKDEAIERIKINTRHLAKRQMTWFRRDRSITWAKTLDPQEPPC